MCRLPRPARPRLKTTDQVPGALNLRGPTEQTMTDTPGVTQEGETVEERIADALERLATAAEEIATFFTDLEEVFGDDSTNHTRRKFLRTLDIGRE